MTKKIIIYWKKVCIKREYQGAIFSIVSKYLNCGTSFLPVFSNIVIMLCLFVLLAILTVVQWFFFAKVIKKKYIYSYVEKKLTIKMSLHNIMNIKILELNVYSSNN